MDKKVCMEIIKRVKIKKIICLLLAVILIATVALIGTIYIVRWYGRSSLLRENNNPWSSSINSNADEIVAEVIDGETYYYQPDILNILCVGIDKEGELTGVDYSGNSRGQSDAIFLISLDLRKKDIRIITVPRDTVVNLEMYDVLGNYMGTAEGQIALQYAYGDGMQQSAELVSDRVSDIFGTILISGYAVFDLECIQILNDLIGGVDVTMDQDYTMLDEAFVEGETVHLTGEQTMHFVRNRDTEIPASAYTRLNRQKLYLEAFATQAKLAIKENIGLPAAILEEVKNYMVTDMSTAQILYLATEVVNYDFSGDSMYVLEGSIVNNNGYEWYYLDQDALNELKIRLFYVKKEKMWGCIWNKYRM